MVAWEQAFTLEVDAPESFIPEVDAPKFFTPELIVAENFTVELDGEIWDEIRALRLLTTDLDEPDKRENKDLVMSFLSCLGSEFSELRYNSLRSNEMPFYDEVICMIEKEISARKFYDALKAKKIALVEENGSIAQTNTSTQVGNNNQGKRAPTKCQKCDKIGHLDKWCKNCEPCGKQGYPKEKCWELHRHLKPKDLPRKPNIQEAKHATERNPTLNLLEELAKLVNSHKVNMSHEQCMKSNLTACFES
ncbi:hypothetical protein ACH5RR_039081 [Cinchona calisaya]|uniref:CCHC-type domain-containing protein n=1 Tax=Cinchona calisaya TaxID=153742 RepID=A0ABD2XYK5_9GENT